MKKIAIIGLGTMGSAIKSSLEADYEITGIERGDDLTQVRQSDVIILAVKPQSFAALSQDLRQYVDGQIVLSIMAGISCREIAERLATKSVVRSMPNLGLMKAKSVTGAYAFDGNNCCCLENLLRQWGSVVWLEKEADFDGFTALAGSGPAYFFELARQLQVAAEKLGFDSAVAQTIVNGTLVSAAATIDGQLAADRVQQVASKDGATEAALAVLTEHTFGSMIDEAVLAAVKRSKELSL
jgi:pyrroline-5-carboxylate reductase